MKTTDRSLGLGKFVWRKSTANHYTADVDDCASIECVRNPGWKRLGQEKPWRVVLFGNPHTYGDRYFENLDDAAYFAEQETINRIGRMTERMRMSWRQP